MCSHRDSPNGQEVSIMRPRKQRRIRSCEGKRKFSEERANEVALAKTGKTIFQAYECEFCKAWHVGRVHTSNIAPGVFNMMNQLKENEDDN